MKLHTLNASDMVQRLASGELSSVALVQAHLARIDAVDGRVGAFVYRRADEALAEARAVDAARARGDVLPPLAGVPISLKENLALVGQPQTMGIRARAARKATEDAPIVAAVKASGAIVLGTTNVPQLLLSMESDNVVYGTTANPWDLTRAPGGSSGGEGAAIAAGMSPWGLGTDIGGSVRIPAAWCGIAGLKPTSGRWSKVGVAGGQPGQEAIRSVVGPMARSVRDLTLMMQALSPSGQHALDPRVPPLDLLEPSTVDLSGLTVGVYEDDGVLHTSDSVRRAVREAAAAVKAAGATVVPYAPPLSYEMFDAYFGLMSADGSQTMVDTLEGDPWSLALGVVGRANRLPSAVRRTVAAVAEAAGEGRMARLLRAAGDKKTTDVWKLVVQRERLKSAEFAAWQAHGIDVLIGPPTVTPPARLRSTHDWSVGAWNTMRYNLLDLPAGVVPVTRVQADEQTRTARADRLDTRAAQFEEGSEGLPVCAQVIGLPWQEHRVLAVMQAIEDQLTATGAHPVQTPVDPR